MRGLILNLSLLLLLSSCASSFKGAYHNKNAIELSENDVLILTLNEFQGQTDPIDLPLKKGQVSGDQLIQEYLSIIEQKYPKQTILASTGNYLGGSHRSQIKPSVASYTIREDSLPMIGRYKGVHFINSNIINIRTKDLLKGTNLESYTFKNINGKKILFISLAQPRSNYYTYTTNDGLYYEDPVLSVIKLGNVIRSSKNRPDLVIALTDIDTSCHQLASGTINCNEDDDFKNILKRFPPDTIDLVINSTKYPLSGLIEGMPVIQVKGQGTQLGVTKVVFDETGKKVIPLPMINTCSIRSKNSDDCLLSRDKEFMPAKFLGKEITGK